MVAKLDGTNGLLQQYDYQAPSTGFSYTFAAGVNVLVMNPAGTLATGTITMPASPADGMTITFSSTQAITALTVNANTSQSIVGKPTSFGVGSASTFVYRLSNTTWYPTTAYANSAIPKSSLPAGTVLQVQQNQVTGRQTGANAWSYTTSALGSPTSTTGSKYLEVSFTPISATSLIKIEVYCSVLSEATNTADQAGAAIWKNNTGAPLSVLHIGTFTTSTSIAGANSTSSATMLVTETAGSTDTRTYSWYAGVNGGGSVINSFGTDTSFGGQMSSIMTVTEIAA
jgi:hypothetical protein